MITITPLQDLVRVQGRSCGETAGEDEPDNGYSYLGLQPTTELSLERAACFWPVVGGTDRMNKKRPRQ
ncbi:hypothetical protein QR685DRAFT_209857 [Neurospora intermedia]|uniref:Uncharacterized protein n=1 Tax=Neurospora intermedia TaxID=5142 RepID=A0ABR3DIN6_NEUIN